MTIVVLIVLALYLLVGDLNNCRIRGDGRLGFVCWMLGLVAWPWLLSEPTAPELLDEEF